MNKTLLRVARCVAVCVALICGMPRRADAAHLVEQTFDVQPGWNALFLRVQPESNAIAAVFQDVPISSVWTWLPEGDPAEFVQNLSETLHNDPKWLVYFPTNRVESMFNDLYRVHANRPYFVKSAGTTGVTWRVTGRPAVTEPAWQPNRYNLMGFPLDPAATLPSVQNFLAPSPALQGQNVYRLNVSGAWQLIANPAAENMRAGECLWFFAAAESDYAGLLDISMEAGDGLDYGGALTEKEITIENRAASAATVSVHDLSGPGGPLTYWTFDTNTSQVVWAALPDPLQLTLGAGESHALRLAVRRELFSGDTYETTVEISSDQGMLYWIPLAAARSESY
ncbi:MAG: hypothetical protein JXR37_13910 [Kiritimatiellae bacterium]|nr:hypothetical protein [Kiritimatiellia bacterium]